MTGRSADATPVFTSIAAHLYVRDLPASIRFFTKKLGFAIDFVYGEPAFYAQVRRDQALLALRPADEPVFAGIVREREDLLTASITLARVGEVQLLFSTWQAAGVSFHQGLREEIWGAETFVVRDPDGNLILFAGPAD